MSCPFSCVNAPMWPTTNSALDRAPRIVSGISIPVWTISIFAAGTPFSINPRRTAAETAMMPWHVRVYFSLYTHGCLGWNATWRVTTRQTREPMVSQYATVCARPLCAWTMSAVRNPSFAMGNPADRARSASALDGGHTMVCRYPRVRSPRASVSKDSCPPRQASSVSTWMIESGRRKTNVAVSRGLDPLRPGCNRIPP